MIHSKKYLIRKDSNHLLTLELGELRAPMGSYPG